MTKAILQLEIPGDRLPDLLAGRARIEGIPEGAHLRAAFWMGDAWPDPDGDHFIVSIEHDSLPEVPAGRRIPRKPAELVDAEFAKTFNPPATPRRAAHRKSASRARGRAKERKTA